MEPNTGVTFGDVAGVDEAKQDFMEVRWARCTLSAALRTLGLRRWACGAVLGCCPWALGWGAVP